MNQERRTILFRKYLDNSLDLAELEELTSYLNSIGEDEFSALVDQSLTPGENANFDSESIFQHIEKEVDKEPVSEVKYMAKPKYLFYLKIAAAASIFLVVSYFIWPRFQPKSIQLAQRDAVIKSPADSLQQLAAQIQLADGKTIQLSDASTDTIHYKGLSILRLSDGTISLQKEPQSALFAEDAHHHFAALRGEVLKLLLPDETRVTLNSGSSIDMAVSYGKGLRQVTLHGEGFFEVTHNQQVPFIVQAKNSKVQVYGTTFNISAYGQDAAVKTTLVSGSVSVGAGKDTQLIKPGQQALVQANADIQILKNPDMQSALAWREGYFRFRESSIAEIMHELAKWYPISEVQIDKGLEDKFTGSFRRTKQLKDVLDGIEQVSNLTFQMQEGRIRVMR